MRIFSNSVKKKIVNNTSYDSQNLHHNKSVNSVSDWMGREQPMLNGRKETWDHPFRRCAFNERVSSVYGATYRV